MDIEYDPTEIDEDEIPGGRIHITRGNRWQSWCNECGLLATAADDSRDEHDRMIEVFAQHRGKRHGGSATPTFDEQMMMFRNER